MNYLTDVLSDRTDTDLVTFCFVLQVSENVGPPENQLSPAFKVVITSAVLEMCAQSTPPPPPGKKTPPLYAVLVDSDDAIFISPVVYVFL